MDADLGFPVPTSALLATATAALLLLPGAAALDAQQASITGRVLSAENGEPIGGAEVRLEETPHRAITSENGLFRMERLPAGEHVLRIEYLGAESRDFRVVLGTRESLDVAFDLRMTVIPVPELEVTVNNEIPVGKLYGFHRRAENSPGYFITRDEIEDRNTSRTTDLLRQVPGLDIGPAGLGGAPLTMGRREGCVPDYYVDGARAPHFDVDNLQPIDIAGIEVYRGNSEVPAEFKHADICGVIVLWTRDPSNWRSFQ